MNKERREKLTKLQEQLDGISTDIEALRDEEQEAMDNMPESLQGSERYEAMESAVSYLDDVLSSLEEASSCIESAME
ncbi:MAG: hypothetical protein EOM68_25465 [Spirochaetia bacterium]|nr:hypothetical protein [Spirochaetia bacterium]